MLYKFVATWLVVFGILPFTPPFAPCDAASLFASAQDPNAPQAHDFSVTAIANAAIPIALSESNAESARASFLCHVSFAPPAAPSPTAKSSAPSPSCITEDTVLSTVLRV